MPLLRTSGSAALVFAVLPHPATKTMKSTKSIPVLAFIGSIDIRELAVTVMHKLFAMLEMKYDFKLSTDCLLYTSRCV